MWWRNASKSSQHVFIIGSSFCLHKSSSLLDSPMYFSCDAHEPPFNRCRDYCAGRCAIVACKDYICWCSKAPGPWEPIKWAIKYQRTFSKPSEVQKAQRRQQERDRPRLMFRLLFFWCSMNSFEDCIFHISSKKKE